MSYSYLPILYCDEPDCLRRYRLAIFITRQNKRRRVDVTETRKSAAERGWVHVPGHEPTIAGTRNYVPPMDFCPRHAPSHE
jgi:hypothetical protein